MTTPKNQKPVRSRRITQVGLMRLLLLAVVLAAFGRTLGADFVNWDDGALIYGKDAGLSPPTWECLVGHWNPTDPSNISMYDPLVFTAWWGIAHLAQVGEMDSIGATMNPLWFHAANLLVHWLTVCVIFEILRNMGFKSWAAFFGAAAFAIHPLQTESVAWATALKDLMCGLFTVLAVWRYLVACQSREKRRVFGAAKSDWNYILAVICFTLAMLAKPSGVVALPFIVVLLVFWYRIPISSPWQKSREALRSGIAPVPRRRDEAVLDEIRASLDNDGTGARTPAKAARLLPQAAWSQLLRLASWTIIALIFVEIAKTVQSVVSVPVPLLPRPLIAADALAFYLYKIALPINLVMDYGRAPLTLLSMHGWDNPLRWTWIVPLAVALLIAISRRRYLAIAGACLVIGVLPTLGLTTFVFQFFTTVADRYIYLGIFGVAIAIAGVLNEFPRAWAYSIFGIVLATWCGLSFYQAGIWQDTPNLYVHEMQIVKSAPQLFRHYITYAKYCDDQADIAKIKFDGAFDAKPPDLDLANKEKQIGESYMLLAVKFYLMSLQQYPMNGLAYDYLATDYLKLGDIPRSIATYERLAELNPILPPQMSMKMGDLQLALATEYGDVKRYAEAQAAYERALRYKPDRKVEEELEKARALAAAQMRASTRPSPLVGGNK